MGLSLKIGAICVKNLPLEGEKKSKISDRIGNFCRIFWVTNMGNQWRAFRILR